MKNKILIIGKRPLASLGGLEVHSAFIANYFKNLGYQVQYIATEDHFNFIKKIYGIKHINIFLSCLLIRIKFLFKLKKYDLIFAQEYTGAFFPKSIKLFNFHHICQAALNKSCETISTSTGNKLLTYQKEILEYLSTHDRNVLTVSDRVGTELSKHGARNTQIINNCIPGTSFLLNEKERIKFRRKLDIKNSENVILFAGRSDTSWKGVDLLKNILGSNWSKKYTWLILSDSNIDIENDENTRVIKNVPHNKIFMYYQISDSALFLSRYEGDSYYLIESLAAGLNVCAFDAGTSFQLLKECKLDGMYLGHRTNDLINDADKVRNNLNLFFSQSNEKKTADRQAISKSIQTVRSVASWESSLKSACDF